MLQMARLCFRGGQFLGQHLRRISTKKYDPLLVEQLTRKIDDAKTFVNIDLNDFKAIYADDDSIKSKVERLIDIYDNLKYSLEDVPTTLSQNDMLKLIQLESYSEIRRSLKKLHHREFEYLLRRELKKFSKSVETVEDDSTSSGDRSGLFNMHGDLQYGLWHNTLFTRIRKSNRTRFSLDRLRNVELFGQNLFLDMSFSKHLNYHLSLHVANDLGKLLCFNCYNLRDPFKVTLCGVDYEHYLWKALCANFANILELTHHTERTYLDLCSDRSNLVYITCLEKSSFLEYDPEANYVMAAISEKDIQSDFLTPKLKKLNIKRQGIPIDQYVLWQSGSKRLNLNTKLRILNDIRSNKGWKETLLDNIRATNFKTEEQIRMEDSYRLSQLKNAPPKDKRRKKREPRS